jgi:hypothetical protein
LTLIQTNSSVDMNVTPVRRVSNASEQHRTFDCDDDDMSVFSDGSYVNGLLLIVVFFHFLFVALVTFMDKLPHKMKMTSEQKAPQARTVSLQATFARRDEQMERINRATTKYSRLVNGLSFC